MINDLEVRINMLDPIITIDIRIMNFFIIHRIFNIIMVQH